MTSPPAEDGMSETNSTLFSLSLAPGRSQSIFRFVHWLNLNPNTTCSKCAEKQQLQWFNGIANAKSRAAASEMRKRKNGKAISRQPGALLLPLSFYYRNVLDFIDIFVRRHINITDIC